VATNIEEKVWIGSDNISEFVIQEQADEDNITSITDLSSFTRAVFCIGEETADSAVVGPSVIWLSDIETKINDELGVFTGNVVKAKLGQVLTTAGTFENSMLILYSLTYPNGLVVSDNMTFVVLDSLCT
jgi:hypothetical protein